MFTQTALLHGHKWFRSKGDRLPPSKLSFAHARKESNLINVAFQHTPKDFWYASFRDAEAFWKYYKGIPDGQRRMATIDHSNDDVDETVRLYVDIEWYGSKDDADIQTRIDTITSAIHDVSRSRDESIDTSKTMIDMSRETPDGWKHSFHVHYGGIVFGTTREMGAFMRTVEKKLAPIQNMYYYATQTKRKMILDMRIYTSNRQMRLPGSDKVGSMTKSVLPAKHIFMQSLTSGCRERATIRYEHEGIDLHTLAPRTRYVEASSRTPRQLKVANRIRELLSEFGDTTTRVVCSGNPHLYYGSGRNRECLIDGNRTSEECYFIVCDDNRIFYHCLSSAGLHRSCAGIYIGNFIPDETVKWRGNEFIGECVHGSHWKSSLNVDIKEYDDRYVRPFVLQFGRRVLVCIAGMGKGKTTQARRIISDMHGCRVLYVVPRRSLAKAVHTLLSEHDFTHYADGVDADRLVIEYESLHRLDNNKCRRFDLVIIDEIRSVCGTMTQTTTNGTNIQVNAAILQSLAKSATITIAMGADAEVDPAVPHLIQNWWPAPGMIQVERYTSPAMTRDIYATEDEMDWTKRIAERLASGDKVAICCRTKRRAKALESMFRGDRRTLLITGDTPDVECGAFLMDPDAGLAEVQLFVFTSKVNIGVDIQLEWNTCFIDGYGKNGFCCGARDLVQMCGRFRNLSNPEVYTLVRKSMPIHEPVDALHAKVSAYYRDRYQTLNGDLRGMLSYDAVFEEGYLTMAPGWVTLLFTYCAYESFADFTYELYRISKLKRYRVFRVQAPSKKDPSVKECVDRTRGDDETLQEDVFNEIRGSDYNSIIAECEENVRRHTSSVVDQVKLDCAHVLKYFNDDIDFDEFKAAKGKMQQLRNLKRHENLNTEQVVRMEVNRLHKHMWADHTLSSVLTQFKKIDDCLALLDVGGVRDTNTQFTSAQLAEHADEIYELCEASATAGKRRGARNKRTRPNTITVLKRELRDVYGIDVISNRIGSSRSSRTRSYNLDRAKVDPLLGKVDFGYSSMGDLVPTLGWNGTGVGIKELHTHKKRKFDFD